jgi:hypothetical protein
MAKHNIVRLDNMTGIKVPTQLVSVIVYDKNKKEVEVDNGTLVYVSRERLAGEREVKKAYTEAPSDVTDTDVALLASPENVYDERQDDLEGFTNEAGVPARAYILNKGDVFAVAYGDVQDAKIPEGKVGAVTITSGEENVNGYDKTYEVH